MEIVRKMKNNNYRGTTFKVPYITVTNIEEGTFKFFYDDSLVAKGELLRFEVCANTDKESHRKQLDLDINGIRYDEQGEPINLPSSIIQEGGGYTFFIYIELPACEYASFLNHSGYPLSFHLKVKEESSIWQHMHVVQAMSVEENNKKKTIIVKISGSMLYLKASGKQFSTKFRNF